MTTRAPGAGDAKITLPSFKSRCWMLLPCMCSSPAASSSPHCYPSAVLKSEPSIFLSNKPPERSDMGMPENLFFRP